MHKDIQVTLPSRYLSSPLCELKVITSCNIDFMIFWVVTFMTSNVHVYIRIFQIVM